MISILLVILVWSLGFNIYQDNLIRKKENENE